MCSLLSHDMVLDTDAFSRRIKRLYDAWMNPDDSAENDALSSVDCFVVSIGDDSGKAVPFHKWLFGYELNNTICVFTRDHIYILATKKAIDFLKPAKNDAVPNLQLLVRDRANSDAVNFTKLLDTMRLSRNGKKIGAISEDNSTDRFCASWQKEMAAYNFETIDISASLAYIMAVKDESELDAIRNACLVSANIFKSYLKPLITEIINDGQDVKHSKLADGVKRALVNEKFIPIEVDTKHLDLCYPPIIQSGGNYRFDFNAGSDENYLQSGAIVCSFGVRYKSYCSNISRTLLSANPTDIMQMNYNFIQSLEKELLQKLAPGAKLCDIYDSCLEYAKKVRPDLAEHLTKTFGFAIGIEFGGSSLIIGPTCTAIVKQNMVFNVCIGLTGLINPNDDKTYALCYSDTVIVNESPQSATILTDSPPYLKLLVDCWEHIMDFLPFQDLLAMSQTCRAINQLTGYYFRENLTYFHNYTEKESIRCSVNHGPGVEVPSSFLQFTKELALWASLELNLDAKKLPALKSLIYCADLNEIAFRCIKNLLPQLESIYLNCCIIPDEIAVQIVDSCSQLKRLRIVSCSTLHNTSTKIWFSKNFPILEQLVYTDDDPETRIDELKNFLEKHPHIKRFETDGNIVWANRDLLSETNIKLDIFGIHFYDALSDVPAIQLFDFVNTLYERGFYKALYLKFSDELNRFDLITLSTILSPYGSINVKELRISLKNASADRIEFMAKNLLKLEYLEVEEVIFEKMVPFVSHSASLKKIKIIDFGDKFFDSFALNEERKKLENAVQVAIHLPEDVYLTEMWKTKNLNLEHVKIVRSLECRGARD